ncbi:ABC transporter substrate-binding protein [Siccirubricoccus sp. KC 17139]|uniref:ABC transporter substrate-binding protein n=1 Tax=Siccirubricoccus soli TaxID=2899147 RepID=A0ABT1D8V2_9PROT|nr:ABC transporter substrate-binding protein [Siccirubricoccus soli]MCO6418362.1 ABC transporter substrate-binding protein [Siccirubricoccus soli]MCP2684497.1 ABC transporter substrate-binding protein [Siccirubricoccus soli]
MRRFALAAALLCGTAFTAQAQTFRWANDGDVNSMDPYTRQETFLLSFGSNFYEPLVRRNRQMQPEPALAERWEQPSPTVWRFHLRRGVKFTDGTPFTADDVVFSAERVRAPGSNLQSVLATVKEVRKIDDHTVEFETSVPDPILIQEITNWGIFSRVWAEKNNATRPADLTSREENFATRNAMGTGPFRLVLREPDRRTIIEPNPDWWDKPEHNIQRAELNIIANDATRVAALLSGEVDFVYTVPPQDVDRIGRSQGVRIIQGPELRTIFLGMDQMRPQLLKSDVQGKNPFQDVRVRRAMLLAIDMNAIQRTVMRGQSRPSNLIYGPGVNGFLEADDVRPPVDLAAARKLLTEAGYPNGFGVTMDCPNDRYVNDEAICTAIVAMLARINIRVTLNAQTRARYFAEINAPRYNTSFYLLGWTPTTSDAHNAFFSLAGSRNGSRGVFNNGGYSNPQLDTLIDQMAVETDPAKRQRIISEAARVLREDVGYIPLHQQQIVWAARNGVDVPQTADNYIQLRWVRLPQR